MPPLKLGARGSATVLGTRLKGVNDYGCCKENCEEVHEGRRW